MACRVQLKGLREHIKKCINRYKNALTEFPRPEYKNALTDFPRQTRHFPNFPPQTRDFPNFPQILTILHVKNV